MTTPVQLEQPHAEFCLNPLHKGPCKKTDTPTYKKAVPHLRKVPGAPPDISEQESRGQAINAGLAAARQRGELLADRLGLRGKDRQGVQHMINDYGRQLHARNAALQAAQRIHDQLQRAHDRAQAQNLQAQLRAKLTNMRRADAARKQLARELARQARGGRHGHGKGKGPSGPMAGEARQIIKSAGFTLDQLDEIEVPSVFAPLDPALYALAAVPAEIALYGLDPHAYCGMNEFCRNPLHPGPCKGWKHMLHSVAPGAYHAYERSRVDRLNAARMERVKQLQAAGLPVPKHLLKPITYAEVPKPPPGTSYVPPTPEQAKAILPATAKEIAAKIAAKHAALGTVQHPKGPAPGWKEGSRAASVKAMADAELAGMKQDIDKGYYTPEYAKNLAQGVAEKNIPAGAKVYTDAAGKFTIVDHKGDTPPEMIHEAQHELIALNKANPLPGHLLVHFTGDKLGVGAATSTPYGIMLAKEVTEGKNFSPGFSSFFMPSAESVSKVRYHIAHEYGHALMQKSENIGGPMNLHKEHKEHLSPYGQHDHKEGYAEAFADWHLTGGKTTNPATQAYAKKFGWKTQAEGEAAAKAEQVGNGHKALIESAKALGANVNQPAAKAAEGKMHEAAAELQPGQKLSEHPKVAATIAMLAKKAATGAGLSKEQEHQIHEDLAAHVDQGIPEAPELVKSAAAEKIAKQLLETKQKAEKAKAAEKAAHQELTAQTLSHLKQSHDSLVKSPGSIAMALDKLKQIQEHEHTSEAQKTTAGGLAAKYEAAKGLQGMHATQLEQYKKINVANLTPAEATKAATNLGKIADHYAATPAQAKLAKDLQEKFAEAAKQPTPSELATVLSHHATSPSLAFEHAAKLGPDGYAKLSGFKKEDVQVKLGAIALNGTPSDKLKAFDALNKLGIKDHSVPKALAVAKGEVQLAPSSKATFLAQVKPEVFAKLSDSQKHKILGAMEGLHAYHGSNPEVKQKLEDAYHQLSGSHLPGASGKLEPEDHVGKLLEGVSPAGQEVAGFPPVPPHLSAGAKHAAAVANGTAPGAKLAKTHIKAYADLTSDEYHELPQAYKDKIAADLDADQAKFLDPKKKDQVVAIKEQLGIGHPGEAGGGAGAGGGTPVHVQETHDETAKKVVDSIEAINMLAGSKELGPDIKAALVPGTAQMLSQGKYKPPQWDTVAAKFVEHNIDQHLPLTPSQKDALTAEVKAEMDSMSQVNATKPPENGLMAQAVALGSVEKAGGHVPPEAWSKLLEEHAPGASLNAKVAKQVAAVQGLHKHAEPDLPADVDPAELATTLKEQYGKGNDTLAEKVLEGHAATMAQNAWTTAVLQAGLNKPGHEETMVPDSLKQSMIAMLKLNYLNAIKQGKTEPEGVAGMLPSIANQAALADHPNLAHFLDAYNDHLDKIADKAAIGTPAEVKEAAKPAAKATSSAKGATLKAVKLGGGTKIDHIDVNDKKSLTADFKSMPKGKYLQDPTPDVFDNLVALAAVHGKKPGVGPLSVEQVMKIVDETHSDTLHVENKGMLEAKIKDWLATPDGKAYAQAHLKPDPAIVKGLTGEITLPKGVKLKPGEKVQTLSGPGAYDAKVKAHEFQPLTMSQAQNSQAKYMKEQGITWTPDSVAALQQYTGSQYAYNTYLRGTAYSSDNKTKQQVIDIQAAMLPLQQHTLLKRGTGLDALPPGFQDPEAALAMKGKTFEDPGFGSTTVAGESGHFSSKPLQLTIEAPAGTPAAVINDISYFKGIENEVLLAAGTKFKVISVEKKHGQVHMRVRVVTKK